VPVQKCSKFDNHILINKVFIPVRTYTTLPSNHLFGKTHNENSIELMRQKALGRKYSEDTKLKMSAVSGKPVYIYEKFSSEGFNLIGSFVSARRAGKLLGISGSTVIKYMNSGEIFKDRYKFSSK
jgi:group I intron endonuclease